jgi:hypothetical protein
MYIPTVFVSRAKNTPHGAGQEQLSTVESIGLKKRIRINVALGMHDTAQVNEQAQSYKS